MKNLLLLLSISICFVACERNLPKTIGEVERSGKHAWSYLGMKSGDVEAELEKAGWVQNYSGKTYASSPVVLYIYNRPGDNSWGPCHYQEYAYSNQKTDREALRQLSKSGKAYGELYMIMGDDVVVDMGIAWILPTEDNHELDAYGTFSKAIYKAYKSECGNSASWEGKIEGKVYSEHSSFMDDLLKYKQPKIKEDASYRSSVMKCAYTMESAYHNGSEKTFEFVFRAEKYTK